MDEATKQPMTGERVNGECSILGKMKAKMKFRDARDGWSIRE
jgi:hypothetical protein